MIPVNIESDNPIATQQFIDDLELSHVAKDFSFSEAYGQFQTGFIPLFVIINGVQNSSSHEPWQVLYRDSGYPGAPAIREIIDQVQPQIEGPPSLKGLSAPMLVEAKTSFSINPIRAQGTLPMTYEWFHNGDKLPNQQAQSLHIANAELTHSGRYHLVVSNELGNVESPAVEIEVIPSMIRNSFVSETRPTIIPDDNPEGTTSEIEINQHDPVFELNLEAQLSHSWPDDLSINLIAPDATKIPIDLSQAEVTQNTLSLNVPIAGWLGGSPFGKWSLSIVDNAPLDEGRLVSWKISVVSLPITVDWQTRLLSPPIFSTPIPDNDPEGVTLTFNVSDSAPLIKAEFIGIIKHSYPPDLEFELTPPNQSPIKINTPFLHDGFFAVGIDIPMLQGNSAQGEWKLKAVDQSFNDFGFLNRWEIRLSRLTKHVQTKTIDIHLHFPDARTLVIPCKGFLDQTSVNFSNRINGRWILLLDPLIQNQDDNEIHVTWEKEDPFYMFRLVD